MSFLDLIGGLQTNSQSPDPFGTINRGLAAFTSQMEADRQRTIQEQERKRLLDLQAAERKRQEEDRKRKQQEEKLKFVLDQGLKARTIGDNQGAANLLNQANPLMQNLYGFAGPDVMGAPTGVYDVNTRKQIMDYNNPATAAALDSVFGQTKATTLAPGHSIARNGKIEVTAPYKPMIAGSDRSGRQVIDLNNVQDGQQVTAPIVPAARGGGGQRRSAGGGGRRQAPAGRNQASDDPAADIVPGTQNANGRGGLRLDDPRTLERIDRAAEAARQKALKSQPMTETFDAMGRPIKIPAQPAQAQYAADMAEYKVRRRWGQNVKPPVNPGSYTGYGPNPDPRQKISAGQKAAEDVLKGLKL